MIFDKGLTTYVPKTGRCASACAFMFFAGNNRQATGRLGVHQFYSNSDDETAKVANVEYGSQFTVSEIIGYLNEFETPPFVFEKMFAQKQMYFFSDNELAKLNTAQTDESTLAKFSKIDEFVIKAKKAIKQDKAGAIEPVPKKVVPKSDETVKSTTSNDKLTTLLLKNTYFCKFTGLRGRFVLNTGKGTIRIDRGGTPYTVKVGKNKTSSVIWNDNWGEHRLRIRDNLSATLSKRSLRTNTDQISLYIGECPQN